MIEYFLLNDKQFNRIKRYFPPPRGVSRVDDKLIVSGIIFVIKNGLRWRDIPPFYGNHKTVYNRFIRWSKLGVFSKIFTALARKSSCFSDIIMIDATHLKAHRTAASLLKKGILNAPSEGLKAG